MTETARWRLRLWADPSRLTGFDGEAILGNAQTHLRQLRGDVALTHIERISADSIAVVLRAAATLRSEDIDEIAADLRTFLEIGPGLYEEIPDEVGQVRGIGGPGTCSTCEGSDGTHLPGVREAGPR